MSPVQKGTGVRVKRGRFGDIDDKGQEFSGSKKGSKTL